MPHDQDVIPRRGSDWIAPDCAGMGFYVADHGLRCLLALCVPTDVRATLELHWARLGKLAGERLDELARIAALPGAEALARQVATAMYNAASAGLLAWEGSRPRADAGRALYAGCVLEHRLSPCDPPTPEEAERERAATALTLRDRTASWDEVAPLLAI